MQREPFARPSAPMLRHQLKCQVLTIRRRTRTNANEKFKLKGVGRPCFIKLCLLASALSLDAQMTFSFPVLRRTQSAEKFCRRKPTSHPFQLFLRKSKGKRDAIKHSARVKHVFQTAIKSYSNFYAAREKRFGERKTRAFKGSVEGNLHTSRQHNDCLVEITCTLSSTRTLIK